MGILERAGLHILPPMTATKAQASAKIDLRKVGKDIYELLTYPGRRSFKQRAGKQTVESKPDKLYTPSEVAALLNVSYDTAVRRMQRMKGCVDMGTQTKRYKRGKKLLRISGKHLVAHLRSKTRDEH